MEKRETFGGNFEGNVTMNNFFRMVRFYSIQNIIHYTRYTKLKSKFNIHALHVYVSHRAPRFIIS